MEESLKARLIGAAVLVALAVLLIPELLSGRKAAEPVAEEGAGQRGTRTFTIELGQGRGQATTTSAGPTSATGPGTSAGATSTPPVKPVEEPVAAPSTEPDAEVAASSAAEAPAPEQVPVQAAVESRVAPAPVEAAPAAVRPEPQASPVAAAPKGGWVVQVGAFGSADTARKLVGDLGGAGYRAFVSPVTKGGKTLHRVRVGPEPGKAGAERLAQRLKARGLPATVVQND